MKKKPDKRESGSPTEGFLQKLEVSFHLISHLKPLGFNTKIKKYILLIII